MLGLFVNELTLDEKDYLLTRDNLTQTIQTILPEEEKTLLEFFLAFLKSILNFIHLTRKDDPRS